MKYTLRVPTKEQYAYLEVEYEGTPDEALAEYRRLTDLIHGKGGVGIKELANIVIELVQTGGIKEGGNYDFSANEQLLIGAITKCLRADKREGRVRPDPDRDKLDGD